MKKVKKAIALILALVMAVSFAACSGTADDQPTGTSSGDETGSGASTDSQTAWEDTIVRVAIDTDPGTLGPYESNNTGRKQTLYSVYETLAAYQSRGTDVQGVMAKNWYEDGDNSYVIELYDYIYDTAGNQITTDDVIYSFLDAGYSTFKRYCQYIDSIDKIDDYSFRMTLNSEDVGTLEHILCNVWIVDQGSYEASPDNMANEPVATGPYKLQENVSGSKLVLVANEDYWQTEDLRVKYQYQNVYTIEFIVISETAQKVIAMETGTVDLMNRQTYNEASRFVDDDNYLVVETQDNNNISLIFNCNEQSVCSSLALRQAIMYAIDTEAMLIGCLDGYGGVEYCVGNNLYPDVEESWADTAYTYNTEKARELLAEAGYENGVDINIMTTTDSTFGKVASIMQSYLNDVGINVTISQYESTLAKTYMRDFSTFDIYITDCGSPDYIVTCWNSYMSNAIYEDGLNYSGVNDAVLENLLQTALNSNTHNTESMTELHNYIYGNAYFCGILYKSLFEVGSSIVTDICTNGDNWLLPGCCTYVWNE